LIDIVDPHCTWIYQTHYWEFLHFYTLRPFLLSRLGYVPLLVLQRQVHSTPPTPTSFSGCVFCMSKQRIPCWAVYPAFVRSVYTSLTGSVVQMNDWSTVKYPSQFGLTDMKYTIDCVAGAAMKKYRRSNDYSRRNSDARQWERVKHKRRSPP